ncbi:MAG: type II toxin-antitoxin system HicB family antitoxin [Spirochaetaceae bacterium]|jgi:antitoxin HicB|nr:type II toxin-antitoxin system HicB family antitoxin [Spirochaetaceae bacterium]
MIAYPAKFEEASEGGYVVEFIDIPSCITEGDTLEEAKINAKDALSGVLSCLDSRKINIPEPSNVNGENIYYIEPELKIAFAIRLKRERQKHGLTQKEVAERMRVNWAYYQRIENPRKSNPTLGTIEKLQDVFSCNFFL